MSGFTLLDGANAQEHATTLRTWCKAEIVPHAEAWHRAHAVPPKIFSMLAGLGVTLVGVPVENGYVPDTVEEALRLKCVTGRTLGWADPSTALETAGHALFVNHFMAVAEEAQRALVLPDLSSGRRCAWALSSPSSGSDPLRDGTRAKRGARGGEQGWILNGNRFWITGGADATWLLIHAVTEAGKATAFLVHSKDPGFSASKPFDKVAMPATQTVEIRCDDLLVPDSRVLGTVGGALQDAKGALTAGRLYIASCALGGLDRLIEELELTLAGRHCADGVVLELPVMQAKLRRIRVWRDEADRQIAAAILIPLDQMASVVRATEAKVFATETLAAASSMAAEMVGGAGTLRETPIARIRVDAVVYQVGEGSSTFLRSRLARWWPKHKLDPQTPEKWRHFVVDSVDD